MRTEPKPNVNHLISAPLNKRLNSCIQIESTKINRHVAISQGVSFYLDEPLLQEIEQIRASNGQFQLSDRNLANLRHYALQNLPLESLCPSHASKSPSSIYSSLALTFATRYRDSPDRPPITLVRSAIEPDGKISQQIQQQLVEDTQLLQPISQAHYWLVLEILAQLPLPSHKWHSLWIMGGFYLCLAIALGLIWHLTPLGYSWRILLCTSILISSGSIFKFLVFKQLKQQIIHQLLNGFLARGIFRKQIGMKLLSGLISCSR